MRETAIINIQKGHTVILAPLGRVDFVRKL